MYIRRTVHLLEKLTNGIEVKEDYKEKEVKF